VNGAVTLAEQQRTFIEVLLDDSHPTPRGWDSDRIAIYRNAYRARVVDAIRDTYPRTQHWVGEDSFRRAAIHHVITHPPASWTLDAVGEDFAVTVGNLFTADPEVSELAWLEWAMHVCFVSRDASPFDIESFSSATTDFRDSDWASMRLEFMPGTRVREVAYRIDALWTALSAMEQSAPGRPPCTAVPERSGCVVWRQGMTPVFRIIDERETMMLNFLLQRSTYGEACNELAAICGAETAVSDAGALLGRWLRQGMLAGVYPPGR